MGRKIPIKRAGIETAGIIRTYRPKVETGPETVRLLETSEGVTASNFLPTNLPASFDSRSPLTV